MLKIVDRTGRKELEGLTTTAVCNSIVKDITKADRVAYCDYLVMEATKLGKSCEVVGEANVFISHAWKYHFLDVLDTLLLHFNDEVLLDPLTCDIASYLS
jgi:hypothetical protein